MSLEELEISRKRTLIASRVLYLLAGVLFLFGVGILGILLASLAQLLIKTFRVKAKEALVVPLAEALGFRYSPERGLSQEEALASGLFSLPDAYDSEDLVEGEVNGIPFASSDIALYRRVRVIINNVSFYHYLRFFRGTLYRLHLPFSVEGEVRFGPRGRGTKVVYRHLLLVGIFTIGVSLLLFTLVAFSEKLSAWVWPSSPSSFTPLRSAGRRGWSGWSWRAPSSNASTMSTGTR